MTAVVVSRCLLSLLSASHIVTMRLCLFFPTFFFCLPVSVLLVDSLRSSGRQSTFFFPSSFPHLLLLSSSLPLLLSLPPLLCS